MIDLCAIRKMQNAIKELEERVVAETGLTLNDAMCLCAISRGDAEPGSLARELGLSPSRLTRILDGLEERGLVSRKLSRSDRRSMEVTLTKRGSATLDRFHCADIKAPEELAFAEISRETRQ